MANLICEKNPPQLLADARAVVEDGLQDALSLLHTDRGNIQIVDPASGSLRIAAQSGFNDEFLEYFAVVNDDGSACGRAAQELSQTVIADVKTDSRFAPHRDIADASGFRAVHSTPLLDLRGHLVGVLSMHYPKPYCPPNRDLELIRRFGKLIGQAIEASLEADGQPASWHFQKLIGSRAIEVRVETDGQAPVM